MNMPFSRPGAVDLSGLKRAATSAPTARAGVPGAAGSGAGTAAPGSAYTLEVDEQNFNSLLDASMTAPVVLVVYSPSRMPASAQLADDLDTVAAELDGRIAVGRVNIDAQPAIAQAMQVQAIPLVAMILQGRLAPLLQDAPPLEELRGIMGQVVESMTAQGLTGRHQPLVPPGGPVGEQPALDEGEYVDPRYAPAEDALVSGDVERAVQEYQKLVEANPADTEAALGLARAKLVQRTAGADAAAARAAAAGNLDNFDAQLLVADLDLLGGHVDDAFNRLIELVRRSSGAERDRVRLHLIELFAVVGNEDQRVLTGRRNLASALF